MKKEILNLAELLVKAEGELKKRIENEEEKEQLLTDMQATAIAIGSEIEKIEGEGTRAVECLEEYCELLYQCSISDHKEVALKVYEDITDKSQEFHKLFIEIAQKKEIVFFPYKASMWDSLESVWLAAKNNPKCRVCVVPIPYYDKNKDGSFGQQHYEGADFPEYVSITAWEEYQVLERKPDVIFIHNPYDNGNHVSSVHPDYYAKNLKKYTDMLVYIPYFVMGEDIYENFCVCAGTIHAHKTIVQSEKVRAVYVRCFQEFVKENHLEILFPEEVIEDKFVALGSPKIDKALNCKKEDYFLPQSWEKLIEGKKVVLYNTGLSGILNGKEDELEKIEDVHACFRKRKDIVLWWRPHPLSKTTCASMRPQLYRKYQQIVQNYIEEGFGIYDDTPDLHRAIAYTDMYYGDESSLVYLYGVQGKPIVIQNIYYLANKMGKQQEHSLCFDECAYENGMIWFVARDYNGLFQMDIDTGEVKYLGRVPGEVSVATHLYSKVLKEGNYLWLVPCMAKEIARYDIETGKFMKYAVGTGEKRAELRFQYACLHEKNIYMISGDYKRLVICNTETGSMAVKENFIGDTAQKYKVCRNGAFPSMCVVENKLYFVIDGTNTVIQYDTLEEKYLIFQIGETSNKYMNIVYDGTFFWLIPCMEGNVVRWNQKNQDIQEIRNYPVEFEHSFLFRTACYQNGSLWLFPSRGNMILQVDVNTMQIKMRNRKPQQYDVYFSKKIENGGILFSTRNGNRNHRLCILENGIVGENRKQLKEPENYKCEDMQIFEKLCSIQYESERGYYIYESVKCSLEEILKQMEQQKCYFEMEKKCFLKIFGRNQGNAGEDILNNIILAQEKKCNDIKK